MSDFFQKRCKLGNNITSKLCPANALLFNKDKLDENVSVHTFMNMSDSASIAMDVISFTL